MKEDILEQLAEDYFAKQEGVFTKHNLKFRPSENDPNYIAKFDSVHSDIDLIAINMKEPRKVTVVSCKSWQGGINLTSNKQYVEKAIIEQPIKTIGKRDDWCHFRELCINKWTDSFINTIKKEINIHDKKEIEIEYVILATKITAQSIKDKNSFEISSIIKKHFKNRNVNLTLKIMTIDAILKKLIENISSKGTPSVENTHLSRTLQLIIASGHNISKIN